MLGDISKAEHIYIACGYTDMRKSIDGLAAIVQQNFKLDPFSNSLFLFCGRSSTKMKVLYWEGDGFVLLYKRLENGKFVWPRNKDEVMKITDQQFRWLLEGLKIEQPRNPICGYIQASKRVHIQSDYLYMHQTDADIIHRYSSTVFMELLYQMHIPDTTISKAVSMHTAGHMQEESSETVFQMISKMQKIRFRLLR